MPLVEADLAAQPFFRDLDPALLAPLAHCATTLSVAAGASIFREHEEAATFYLITAGRVGLEIFVPGRGPTPIVTLHPGEALGWSWLFPPYRWQFDAVALDPVTLIVFDAARLRTHCMADHELGYEILLRVARVMAQRLQSTRIQLLDVYGTHVAPRSHSE
jgi:CRP/FNR family cyclic AMP-dependent transcriptional regulator